ncbi:MAG: hypothetical protein MUC90_02860 [Thermoplasmata archaeon]|nr:hypothetical protein [Thermoplasmata archaeon]
MVDLGVLAAEPYPAIVLVGGGLLAASVALYGKRDDSHLDELGTYFGFILGAFIGVMAALVAIEETVNWFTLAMMILLAATLFTKPIKEIPWAAVVGLIAGSAAAYAVWLFLPSLVSGENGWMILAGAFLIVGVIVHMIFHFLEDVLKLTGMILNWRPVMVVVGLVAAAEGVLLLLDSSLASLF